mmetsp:Transcript_99923/g.287163  ORF Transcript_99923/g.287163 Transcript_99923/m.287163 type:complete len:261 (+) Transcript_99923:893-1675(+)
MQLVQEPDEGQRGREGGHHRRRARRYDGGDLRCSCELVPFGHRASAWRSAHGEGRRRRELPRDAARKRWEDDRGHEEAGEELLRRGLGRFRRPSRRIEEALPDHDEQERPRAIPHAHRRDGRRQPLAARRGRMGLARSRRVELRGLRRLPFQGPVVRGCRRWRHGHGGGAHAVAHLLRREAHSPARLLPSEPGAAAARAQQREHQGAVEHANREVRRKERHLGERRGPARLGPRRAPGYCRPQQATLHARRGRRLRGDRS